MSDFTSFLFARPSLVEGIARLIDVGGAFNEYNVSDSPEEADRRALVADWNQVGVDLTEAIRQIRTQLPGHKEN